MVNYQDPVVVTQDFLILSKLWHALAGLYFWELVTTLDYEWDVFRRHRPFRWTIWIYLITRISGLLAILLALVDIDFAAGYNCRVETVFLIIFSFLATAAASLLIVLRILAIWNMKKIVIVIATSAWGTGFLFQIQTIVRIRVTSIPGMAPCAAANPYIGNINTLVGFGADTILLLIMFSGLFRLRCHKSSAIGMGRLLWRQGLIWLLVAFMADVIPMVLICLNLNGAIDGMLLVPWVAASPIAATRIHRGLVDHASAGCAEQHWQFKSSHSKAKGCAERKDNMRTRLSPVETIIPETYEEDKMPQTSRHGSAGSLIDAEGQLYEKPTRHPGLDENVELDAKNGVGSGTESSMT